MIIQLTKGCEAHIDDESWYLIKGFKWRVTNNGGMLYAVTTINRKNIYMHRIITGAKRGVLVDHRDRDSLNNRLANLRLATKSKNGANSNISKRNTSGVKGVSWDEDRNKWAASITIMGKVHHLGRFVSKDNAARAYAASAKAAHGEFANPINVGRKGLEI